MVTVKIKKKKKLTDQFKQVKDLKGRAEAQKKKTTRQKDLGNKFIQDRERLIAKRGLNKAEAQKRLSDESKAELANTPKAIAAKQVETSQEKEKLLQSIQDRPNQSTPTDNQSLPIEKKEEAVEEQSFLRKTKNLLTENTPSAKAKELGVDLRTGTLTLGGAGALAKVPSLVEKGSKGFEAAKKAIQGEKAIKNVLQGLRMKGADAAEKAIRRERGAAAITKLDSEISNDAAIRLINSYNLWSKNRLFKFLSSKPVKTVVKVGTLGASADTIWVWYALDNIADGVKFMVPDIEESFRDGTIDRTRVNELFNEADFAFSLALNKVITSTRYNPLTWVASKLIIAGANLKKDAYEIKKQNFLTELGDQFIDPDSAFFEANRLRAAGVEIPQNILEAAKRSEKFIG